MDDDIVLPNSKYIDINLGLKYLNGNKKLYLKILNSFLTRYKNFNIYKIKEDAFKNEMHSLKGLSSTLGMESLSNLAKNLHKEQTEELFFDFTKTLECIIYDLTSIQTKTLLIIHNNHEDINNIIEILGDAYEVMVIASPKDEIESIKIENIDIVLLNPTLSTQELKHILKQKKISIIELSNPIQLNTLQLSIKSI